MENISAQNLRFSKKNYYWSTCEPNLGPKAVFIAYLCHLKFLATMLFFSNSPYLSRLNFGKLRKNEIAVISSKMTFLHSVKSVVPEIGHILTYPNFSEIYFSKWTPPPMALNVTNSMIINMTNTLVNMINILHFV